MDLDLSDDQVALRDGIAAMLDGACPDGARARRLRPVRCSTSWPAAGVFSLRADGFSWADCVVVFEQLGRFCVPGPLVASLLLGDGRIAGIADRAASPIVDRAPRRARRAARAATIDAVRGRRPARGRRRAVDVAARPVHAGRARARRCPAGDAGRRRRAGSVRARGRRAHRRVPARPRRPAAPSSPSRTRRSACSSTGRSARSRRSSTCSPTCSTRTEVARAAVYSAGAVLDDDADRGRDAPRRGAARRCVAGDAAITNGKAATQVFGGMGFTWEVDVHLYLKRAWVLDTHFESADRNAELVCATAGRSADLGPIPDATVSSHDDAAADHVLEALAAAPRLRSRRSVPRLLQQRRSVVLTAREMDRESNRLAHALAALGVAPRRPRRDAAREPGRAGRQLLRRAQARRGAGADQHRVQGRVPAPPARRLGREGLHRAGRLRVRAAEVVGAETTPDARRTASRSTRPTR